MLCKSEVDSMGRIAAGVLRIFKLEGSVGSAAINQLSNLGECLIFHVNHLILNLKVVRVVSCVATKISLNGT